MTTSRQRWRQCRSMGVPWLFAGRAANQTNNLLRTAREQRMDNEQRANSVRELARTTRELRARTHPRTTRRARLPPGARQPPAFHASLI